MAMARPSSARHGSGTMPHDRNLRLTFIALALAGAATAPAQTRCDGKVNVTAAAAAEANPGILGAAIAARWCRPLYEANEPWRALNGLAFSAEVALAPKAGRAALGVELQPVSFLVLGASYRATYFPGILGLAQSYPSPRSDYGGGFVSSPNDGPGGSESLLVHQLDLDGALLARIGPLRFRSFTRASRFAADVRAGDHVFYDPGLDVVVDSNGWVLQNDTDVAFEAGRRWILGVRHTLVLAWYPASDFAPGEAEDDLNTPISRIGPTVRWTAFDHGDGAIESVSVGALVQWYVSHRYRTDGAERAVPLVGVVLTLSLRAP